MTYFESLDFVYKLILTRFDLAAWIWAIIAFFIALLALHWGWGLIWNKKWTFFKRPAYATTSIVIALLCLVLVLFWFAADRSMTWLELQRAEFTRQFTESGKRNRDILVKARERIGIEGNYADNTLTLRNERDTTALALTAASEVRCPLTASGPLGPGAPCRVRDPATVATEVVHSIPVASYPVTVSPQNPWTEAAVTAQLQEALSYALTRIRTGMDELKSPLPLLIILLISAQVLLVLGAAVSDIRVHPSESGGAKK